MNFETSDLTAPAFSKMAVQPQLIDLLQGMKIKTPTEVQSRAIPLALERKNLIVVSQTGTGKTLAYALPIVSQLLRDQKSRALVIVPTREVAQQIYSIFEKLMIGSSITHVLVIGGTSEKLQVAALRKKANLIVATPGRLNEHLRQNKLLLQDTTTVVIDEADRMLDMGFRPQLEAIRKTMRGTWQTLMLSASFGADVQTIAEQFMLQDPVMVRTENSEKPVSGLKQKVYFVDRGMKNDLLTKELKKISGGVLVFASTQPMCEDLGFHLKKNDFNSDFIHGGLSNGHRNRVLREFRERKIQIMITTDLLARGLDVDHVQCVVNYDLPPESEDFLHRIGRTARAGRKGSSITFVIPSDTENYSKLKNYLEGAEEFHLGRTRG